MLPDSLLPFTDLTRNSKLHQINKIKAVNKKTYKYCKLGRLVIEAGKLPDIWFDDKSLTFRHC